MSSGISFTRTGKELFNQSAAGTGAWVDLDNHYNPSYYALYSVSLEGGDWAQVQFRLNKSDDALVVTQATVSATGVVPIDAPARQIRVVKTGSAGNCRVYLYG